MRNLIGEEALTGRARSCPIRPPHLHLYGKAEAREGARWAMSPGWGM
jgi:phosphoribosylaminoimidazole carboxylase (NCAIR synthetase)